MQISRPPASRPGGRHLPPVISRPATNWRDALPFKKKIRKPKLLIRSILISKEIDDALVEEATNRSWGKSKLIREILVNWLAFYRAGQRKIKVPKMDLEVKQPPEQT